MKLSPEQMDAMLGENQIELNKLRGDADNNDTILKSLQALASRAASIIAVAKDKPLTVPQVAELEETVGTISKIVNPPPPPPAMKSETDKPASTAVAATAPVAPAASAPANTTPPPPAPRPATPAPSAAPVAKS